MSSYVITGAESTVDSALEDSSGSAGLRSARLAPYHPTKPVSVKLVQGRMEGSGVWQTKSLRAEVETLIPLILRQ